MAKKSNGNGAVLEAIGGDVSNEAEDTIFLEKPYSVRVEIEGTTPLLFHKWSTDAVEEKAGAKKGSAAKKTDNIESYVYRNEKGEICLPGLYIQRSVAMAAKFFQDPRSPRKSAFDLFTAGVVAGEELISLGSKQWDYLDRRRVCIQRNAITRERPAFSAGWKAAFTLLVLVPQYIQANRLREVLDMAGTLVGVADFRPTYGRFRVTKWEVVGRI